jgi:hypothetical protein
MKVRYSAAELRIMLFVLSILTPFDRVICFHPESPVLMGMVSQLTSISNILGPNHLAKILKTDYLQYAL